MSTTLTPVHQYRFDGQRFVPNNRRRFALVLNTLFLLLLLVFSPSKLDHPIAQAHAAQHDTQVWASPSLSKVAAYILQVNKSLTSEDARAFARYSIDAATKARINLPVLLALVKIESGFKPEATSKAGAMGLTQVIPKWHMKKIEEARSSFAAYSIYEPSVNLHVGAQALREFIDSAQDLSLGLRRYNGSGSQAKSSTSYDTLVLAEAHRVSIFLSSN